MMPRTDSSQNQESDKDPVFGEVISTYSQDQAIEDGMLVFVGLVGQERVVFTQNLFCKGYEEEEKRAALIEEGLRQLRMPHSDDSPRMRLRVIESNKIWVIWNAGEGVIFLEPEDY